ncbi:hypothetical protein B5X24_HaOG215734 [Helicoverpa armigera]|nr:hypothetical protein B5X24_HaOG215734 [Helicoverpa armigera]
MEFRTKCFLFILLSSTPLLTAAHSTHVYKFGTPNLPGTVLVAHTKGTMAHFDHTKRIQLYVPPCYMPTYVQVEVTNYLATPDVQYNSRTRSVTIHYKTWQSKEMARIVMKMTRIRNEDISNK